MKQIAYIIDQLKIAGGIGRIVSMKANWWAEHDYDVTILVTEGNTKESFYDLNDKVKVIPLNVNFLTVYGNKRSILGFFKSAIDRYKKNKLYKKRVNEYLINNQCDVVFTAGNHTSLLDVKDGSKKIFESHFSVQAQKEFVSNLNLIQRYMYLFHDYRQRQILKRYDKVVLLTERDKILRGTMGNSMVIPNFITIPISNYTPNYQSKHVIIVGRFSYQKGFDYLFPAWKIVCKKHSDWHLDIYGHSYGRDSEYLDLINQLNLSRFVSIYAPVKNITDKYLDSSFYVMSSRFEGFPLVLGEAMACGLPCIAYDCNCGPSEIINDGEDGILIPEVGNIDKLADAICWMIEHPEERIRMGANAKQNIQRYQIDKVMNDYWINLVE